MVCVVAVYKLLKKTPAVPRIAATQQCSMGLYTWPRNWTRHHDRKTRVYLCLVLQPMPHPMPGRQPGVQPHVVAREKQTDAHKKETYSLIVNSAHASACKLRPLRALRPQRCEQPGPCAQKGSQ